MNREYDFFRKEQGKQLLTFYWIAWVSLLGLFSACEPEQSTIEPIAEPEVLASFSCEQTDAIKALYEEDAYQLAFDFMVHHEEVDQDVVISDDYYQQAMDALMAVYNAIDLPIYDTLFQVYDIHTFGEPALYEILIGLNPASAWTRSLLNGSNTTDHEDFNQFLTTYALAIVDHNPHANYILLQSEQALNLGLLAELLSQIEGVDYAEPNWLFGDGHDIQLRPFEDFIELTFIAGYGDCPSGCIHKRAWYVHVYDDCSVEYIGSSQ